MNYYLIKIVINDKGQDGTSINVFNSLDSAIVNYHQTLAAYHNASDVQHAVVEIMDTYGNVVGQFREQIDKYQPEPEPEPSEE